MRSLLSYSVCLILLTISHHAKGQSRDVMIKAIRETVASVPGDLGVAVLHVETKDTVSVNGQKFFPMQSVYKFPLALAILDGVDRGKFSLSQKIHIDPSDYYPKTHSPMANKFPKADIDLALGEIFRYSLSESDNNACDILFRLAGGTHAVARYIHALGIKDISIRTTEAEMHDNWQAQYQNMCTPMAMARLFEMWFGNGILSKQSFEESWKAMTETPTGMKRIKSGVPKGTVVAHKTGLGGTDEKGITSVVNDAGLMVLPNHQHVIIVFFARDVKDVGAVESAMAAITKVVYEQYSR